MQHWLFKAKRPLINGISCFMLIFSLLACGESSNNNGQQTPVAPFVTTTPAPPTPTPSPTDTPVAPFVTATPSPSMLTVDPSDLNPNSAACSSNGDGTYTCNVTVGETSQDYLSWSVIDNLGLRIDPSRGQLTQDQPTQQVGLYSIPCQSDTFTFSGAGGSTVPVTWSCTS